MTTPAFVLNGKVVSYGKVLSIDEVKSILSQNILLFIIKERKEDIYGI